MASPSTLVDTSYKTYFSRFYDHHVWWRLLFVRMPYPPSQPVEPFSHTYNTVNVSEAGRLACTVYTVHSLHIFCQLSTKTCVPQYWKKRNYELTQNVIQNVSNNKNFWVKRTAVWYARSSVCQYITYYARTDVSSCSIDYENTGWFNTLRYSRSPKALHTIRLLKGYNLTISESNQGKQVEQLWLSKANISVLSRQTVINNNIREQDSYHIVCKIHCDINLHIYWIATVDTNIQNRYSHLNCVSSH